LPSNAPTFYFFMYSGSINNLQFEDLDLSATLNSGQMFRWNRDEDGAWRGMVGGRRLRLSQSANGETLYYESDGADANEATGAVRSFLRLDDADLPAMAAEWSAKDLSFAEAWASRPGIRILRQDPEECFFAFLCASVAPIARIRGMLTAVATEFGVTGESGYTRFPEAGQLATASEVRLRELGLGFRARRIVEAASCLAILPQGEIAALRQASLKEAKERLTQFFGVGEKIADCICLFSLDKDGAIPVDTHIWRIARARYAPELAGKSLTPQNYAKVTAAFHRFFGDKAGWAQQILFYRQAVNRDDKARKTIK